MKSLSCFFCFRFLISFSLLFLISFLSWRKAGQSFEVVFLIYVYLHGESSDGVFALMFHLDDFCDHLLNFWFSSVCGMDYVTCLYCVLFSNNMDLFCCFLVV